LVPLVLKCEPGAVAVCCAFKGKIKTIRHKINSVSDLMVAGLGCLYLWLWYIDLKRYGFLKK